ncbi:MAG: AraC family transcriptional regulator, partial [Desulfobacteraceae bacterium]|nr:AraC family transcriptional regulator [Desulfobacteraceae bacterium]
MNDRQSSLKEYKRRICLAMDYIAGHLKDNPSLDEIAQASFFSKYHFHRLFHAIAGETVAQFTRRIKLEKAANGLIYAGHKDITTIALECGFSSSQNFAKAFRKHFSLSPSDYRRKFSKIGNTDSKNGNAPGVTFSYDATQSNWSINLNERNHKMEISVKQMPEYHVAYVRHIGPYGPEGCGKAHEKLFQWAGPRGFVNQGTIIGVGWDNPEVTPPEKCRYDACITVPEQTKVDGEVGLQKIPSGSYAVYRV